MMPKLRTRSGGNCCTVKPPRTKPAAACAWASLAVPLPPPLVSLLLLLPLLQKLAQG
jgi:hypothetical protein